MQFPSFYNLEKAEKRQASYHKKQGSKTLEHKKHLKIHNAFMSTLGKPKAIFT